MGYRHSLTQLTTQLVALRLDSGLSAQCTALRREAGRCWTAMLRAHLASRDGVWLTCDDLQKRFKGQFRLYSQTVQALAEKLIANVETAHALRQTDPTARYPYRDKEYQTVIWKQESIRRQAGHLVLSNGRGNAPLVLPLPDRYATGDIRRCELLWRADHYEVALTFDTHTIPPPPQPGQAAGVDLGEVNIAAVVTARGRGLVLNGRYLRSLKRLRNKRHAALQGRLARCTPGSRRHKRLLRAKARASAAFYRGSRDLLHKAARKLVNFAQQEQVGHLAVGDVRAIADGTDKGRSHNQRMSQWAHGQFVGYIQEKAQVVGITVGYIAEDYSTRTCSQCGRVKESAPRGRVYTCAGCGARLSRDGNGAANICSRYRDGRYGQVQIHALMYRRATAVVPRKRATLLP